VVKVAHIFNLQQCSDTELHYVIEHVNRVIIAFVLNAKIIRMLVAYL